MSEIEARIAEVLAGHQLVGISLHEDAHCTGSGCGWTPTSSFLFPTANHREHVAAMLVPVIREEFAAAVRDLADLVEPYSGIELANSASRADVANWLRARADRLVAR